MEVKIKKDLLVKALERISGVLSLGRKTHHQAAQYVLFKTENGGVSLTATNLVISIRLMIEAEIVQEGSAALAGHRLLKYIKLIDDDEIVIRDDRIIYGNASSKFHSIPVDEYPEFSLEEAEFISMESDDLKEIVRQTVFAAGKDEYRPYLAGLCFERNKHFLRIIGTDGYRLAISQANCCENASAVDDNDGVIIPREAVKEIARISGDNGNSVQIGIIGDKAVFKTSDAILITQLVDGQFPDYRPIVSARNEKGCITVEINKDRLLNSLSRMKVIARDNTNKKMSITKNNSCLTFESNTPGGSVSEEVEIAEGNNDAFKISLNCSYLSDAVKAVVSDTVQLEVCNEKSPLIVRGDGRSLHVIMPVAEG
ncbi:MAG: DNA polymerase III subunit beta [Deltaproteobacteria bacterium]|nr:DNA polymerase III subunit beta [Deltaproteobacteria bacterium]